MCLVLGNAQVYGNAQVHGVAWLYENARVRGNAQVSGDAWIWENALVNGNARVYGNAHVFENARVSGGEVRGNAQVYGDAQVNGGELYGTARVDRGELRDGMKFGRGNYGKQQDERQRRVQLMNSIIELYGDKNNQNESPTLSRSMEYRGTQSNRRAPRRGRGNVRY